MRRSIFFFVVLLMTLLPQSALAFKLSASGVANFSKPGNAIYDSKSAFGIGGAMEFGLGPFFGFEIGAFSLERKYENASATTTTTSTQEMLQMPVLLRAYLGGALSLGAGVYYAQYRGDFQQSVKNNGTGLVSNSRSSYSAAGRSKSDYGFVSSLAFYFPVLPFCRLVIDGRYTIGAKDNQIGSGDLKFNDIQAMAGIQLGF